uniref:C-terminal kinesin n=1 Tax=Schizophyllum commune (strain H4-8 / FGSC 9210) TaxID=578458 RepID=D8Q2L2_SCHCM
MDAERAKAAAIQSTLVAQREEHLAGRRALAAAQDELADGRRAWAREREELEADGRRRDRELRELGEDLRIARADLERARGEATELRAAVSAGSTAQLTLQAQKAALEARCEALASQLEAVTTGKENVAKENEDLRAEVARLKAEAVKHEEIRRRMHNEIQELKGNIRVFCRVRPPLGENEGDVAEMAFPDDPTVPRQLTVRAPGESATGQSRPESHQFAFDRVFGPSSTQEDIFADVADLTQSAVDGFNVCVFAYGQTGSGKSFTMEGGPTPATRGLIPRAVDALFETAEGLKGQGWEWEFEGRFLEIYNETIHDLLAPVDKNDLKNDNWGQDKKGEQKEKHSIKHDPRTGQTHVTGVTTLPLPSPAAVRGLLARAAARRSVAATMANSRSSRSHAVFTVKVVGRRGGSTFVGGGGETRIGALHLVDLAGSERLAHSGVGEAGLVNGVNVRLKETQAINKSLSALGDVIAALGERGASGERHIPYRNSKLTYLLQNSLGGNSKTLMIVNVSPLAAHLGETLTSLRFATKVNNTTIGTARRVVK